MLTVTILIVMGFWEVKIKSQPLPDAAKPVALEVSSELVEPENQQSSVGEVASTPRKCKVVKGMRQCPLIP